ncbi:MAG: Fic/DOC family N-terminal domain-containing protein [Patescibacteria group bacterium]|nr:Fic/DOC family N-terminal domain-containing protein [Patescibacteria group bacterium]
MSIGRYVQQTEGYKSFIPYPFPGENFSELSAEILQKSHTATLLIGKLDGITRLLPDIDFFLRMYIRKDATSSSQIEGTRATMIDAIEAESKTSQNIPDDVDDILHYIDAIHY